MTSTAIDHRLTRPAGIRTIPLGRLTVSYVPDGHVQLPGRSWLPTTTDDFWAEHPEYLDDAGNLIASIGGLLVEYGERAMLIDAGFGPLSMPAQPGNAHGAIQGGALLDNLAALGRTPQEIEAVAVTHLHVDHLGWLWQPAADRLPFAGARIHIAEAEWARPDLAIAEGAGQEILDIMAPQVRTVTDGEEIFPGVHVRIAAGHTVGHTTYVLSSGGQRLIAFGDALHSPVQIGHPDLHAAPDHDVAESTEARRRLIAELAGPDTLGFGNHFADVQFGRVQDGAWLPA
ncbi:MBL fold metallo-hydrolase [Nonomuraea dietziae]|uniref:MBL fold metallo-hydrolase n=1 Tax=Nonomuraea dietziae TaxID=65515 RepID=UPI0034234A21